MKISIIGAGNGGQAMAAHFSILGNEVTLYNRNIDKFSGFLQSKEIILVGELSGRGEIYLITDNISEAIIGQELIMITTPANAHREVAEKIAPYVQDGQVIILNPGRTLGALEFAKYLKTKSNIKVYIAEAQSLIYACRKIDEGKIEIMGIKNRVLLSAFPSTDTDYVLKIINSIFDCFIKANNILETGLENIGAIFHPSIVLLNAANIERGQSFYFYKDISPRIADFLVKVDCERLSIGLAYGIKLRSASNWVSYAYGGIEGDSLIYKMQNNPAYFKILSPINLNSRLLIEDIPTGILPLIELGKLANVETPLLEALLCISQSVLDVDLISSGRTLINLGIDNIDKDEFLKIF